MVKPSASAVGTCDIQLFFIYNYQAAMLLFPWAESLQGRMPLFSAFLSRGTSQSGLVGWKNGLLLPIHNPTVCQDGTHLNL